MSDFTLKAFHSEVLSKESCRIVCRFWRYLNLNHQSSTKTFHTCVRVAEKTVVKGENPITFREEGVHSSLQWSISATHTQNFHSTCVRIYLGPYRNCSFNVSVASLHPYHSQ
ncbi:hypothetical protein CDAR_576941 [Caerostris darwini]|uniref:Uncharacterized protein n=1 Tax=Caerostris darwini TaxID=1538125 RepID=A0AAV4RK59_9ARAC|nr:hypothetical protein CDAR_576941 [Caerostris darwini]